MLLSDVISLGCGGLGVFVGGLQKKKEHQPEDIVNHGELTCTIESESGVTLESCLKLNHILQMGFGRILIN